MRTQAQAHTERLITLEQSAQDYLLILRVSRSPKSVERADYSLRRLLQWCNERGIVYLRDLTRRELLTWSLALQQGSLSKSTVWTLTSTVKAFLRWCEQEQLIPASPLKRGDFPSKPRPAPKPLTLEEIRQLLRFLDGKHWLDKRNVALVKVLLDSGCRRGELVQMKAGDVERGYSLVQQKGGRQHVIHLSADCVKAVQAYLHALQVQEGIRLEPEEPLWLSRRHEPLTGDAVRLLFQRWSEQTGIHLHAHKLRHTSATLRLASGASTEVVRTALGHSDLRSIQSYVKLAQVDARKLLEETSPLRMLKRK